MSMLRDERGNISSMRSLLFFAVMPVLIGMTIAEGSKHVTFQPTVWTVWSGIAMMLIVGCFGPRIAQHLAPQIGRAVAAVSQAKRDAREPSKFDDHRAD